MYSKTDWTLTWATCFSWPILQQRGWTRRPPEVLSYLNHSVIVAYLNNLCSIYSYEVTITKQPRWKQFRVQVCEDFSANNILSIMEKMSINVKEVLELYVQNLWSSLLSYLAFHSTSVIVNSHCHWKKKYIYICIYVIQKHFFMASFMTMLSMSYIRSGLSCFILLQSPKSDFKSITEIWFKGRNTDIRNSRIKFIYRISVPFHVHCASP